MAKKKRKTSKKSPAPSQPSREGSFDPSQMPLGDSRVMEGAMKQFLQKEGLLEEGDSGLAKAQDLMYRAYETEDRDQRLELAQEALAASPDCADAYICVGEMLPASDDAMQWFQWGVEAGERALGGPEGMARYKDHFWGALETRPYMRARLELAQCLWSLGEEEAAIDHCRSLLELNPNDNQGVRYVLCSYYCSAECDRELAELLDAFAEDDAADWHFSRALLAFRREGDSEHARQLLLAAHQANPHIASYLLGEQYTLPESPSFVVRGEETEAASYVRAYLPAWRSTSGAVTWIRKTLRISPAQEPVSTEADRSFLVGSVNELPLAEGEVWQVDVRKSKASGDRPPLWILAVANATVGDLVAIRPCGEGKKPSPREILSHVLEVMRDPHDEEPRRPATIQVRLKTYVKSWTKQLETLGIHCEQDESFEHIDHVFEMMEDMGQAKELSDDELAGCLDEMADLPQIAGQIWQAGMRKLAVWIMETGEPQRPWAALVIDRTSDLILAQDLTLEAGGGQFIWRALAGAILSPPVGEPHLPETVEVESDEIRGELLPYLVPLGVNCEVCSEAEQLSYVFGELAQSLGDSGQPALVDTPGVKTAHVGGLFEAAATFYRIQPWRHIPGNMPIKICCDRFDSGTWYAVVMGQSGLTLGLAMYEDLEVLKALLREDEDSERRNSGLSLMYGEAFSIPVRDLDAAEENGWPVAGPEAYPTAMRINPGMAVRPPLAWELELLEGCLQAVPKFIQREESTPAKMNVPTATGELQLELSWVK